MRFPWLAVFVTSAFACSGHDASKQETTREACVTCHADEAAATTKPPHLQAMFGEDCGSCHDEERFAPAQGFVHTDAFPLTLGHAGPECVACHAETYMPGAIANQCVDCHGARADAVPSPIHAGLSTSCFACHRTDAFSPARFVHSWPLVGAHTRTACVGCHNGMPAQYEGTPTACASCHLADRARADAQVPGHGRFQDTCESCHDNDSF